ncbi:MAG: ABC transporter ATP-binding protein [Thermotaleaceae bacterium]
MLKSEGIYFSYGKEQILKNITLEAMQGEILSLIGPNGSGKSTLLRCLSRLLTVDRGKIFLFDKPLHRYHQKQIAQKIAFLPQFHPPSTMTLWELVAMGRSPYQHISWAYSAKDREIIEWAIDYMGLKDLQHRPLSSISGGEAQRAWIAMILAQNTPILLLDEPVTYMDLRHQWELLEVLSDLKERLNKTIITVFHDINHAMEVSDRVYLLQKGEIHSVGAPEQVITQQSLQEVYGIRAHVCKVQHCWRPVVVPKGAKKSSCKWNPHQSKEWELNGHEKIVQ